MATFHANGSSENLSTKSAVTTDDGKLELKQKIGVWGGFSIIAGTVVGSGIFVTPVGVLAGSNESIGVSLLLWVACGLFSTLAALCYAELGTTILESGSDFAYLNAGYGPPFAFTYVICFMFITSPASYAAKSVAFGTYLAAPFYRGCDPPNVAVKCAAAAAVLILGLVNYLSVRTGARVQIVFTVAKFLGMLIIVIAGFTRLGMGDPVGISNFQNAFDPAVLVGVEAGKIGLAFYQGLYSYQGWNKLNLMSEEVRDVGKTLPKSIMLSMAVVTLFYIMMNIAYLSVLTPTELLSSKAVAITFASKVFPSFAWIMPVLVTLSIFGSLNGSLLTGGRVLFAAARREHLPQMFSMVHTAHKTPGPGILAQVAVTLIMLIPNDFDTLVNMLNFTIWIFFGACSASVLILRRKYPNLKRPYRVPTVIPVIVVLFALYLVIAPLVTNPRLEFVYGISLILVTPLIYYPMVYRKYRLPGMDAITVFLQQTFDVSPTNWHDGLTKANHVAID